MSHSKQGYVPSIPAPLWDCVEVVLVRAAGVDLLGDAELVSGGVGDGGVAVGVADAAEQLEEEKERLRCGYAPSSASQPNLLWLLSTFNFRNCHNLQYGLTVSLVELILGSKGLTPPLYTTESSSKSLEIRVGTVNQY